MIENLDTQSGLKANATPDVKELELLIDLERGFIDRRIFWDDAIYRLELEKIFARCWLFVAHECQVAQPGDILTT